MSKGLRQMNVYTNRVRIYPKNGILYEPNSAMNELYEIARMTRIKILNAVCLYGKHGIQKEEFGSESIKER